MKKNILYYIAVVFFLSTSLKVYGQLGGGKGGLYYRDADGDGWGDPNISVLFIPPGSAYVDNNSDCDDTDANIGAGSLWFIDSDGDGFGETTSFLSACTQPSGYVSNNLDQCPNQYGTNNGCLTNQLGISNNQNYIYTITYQQPFTINQINSASNDDKIEAIKYFDGLGRTKQEIAIRAGGQKEDVINYIAYDTLGRQTKSYLPYAEDTDGGSYRTQALSATNLFYNTEKYEYTTNPYSEKNIEASPLNIVTEQAAPGNAWALNKSTNTDHTIKFDYSTNKLVNEVRLYKVTLSTDYTPSLSATGYYSNSILFKSITKNENWKPSDGYNKTTEEFKDKLGRIVLKRAYNNGQKHDTYYIYDKYGNLSYVLPPKAEPTTTVPNTTTLAELCYQYKYDRRNRLVRKKIPGKDWEYIVYDLLDRPVLVQDGNQRAKSPDEWLFTKYDVLGRVVYTGIFKSNSSQVALQTIFDNKKGDATKNYEEKVSSGSGYAGTYYTNTDFPTSNLEILKVNYYDGYTFNRAGAGTSVNAYGISSISNVKSLSTGTRIKVLGTSSWITTVTYYDYKARPISIYSKNDYLSTTDIVKNKLDFTGRVLESTTTHKKTGKSDIVTIDAFTYDHIGRVKKQTQKINAKPTELIAKNTYDELGQLIAKGIGHAANDTINRLQVIDYKYTVRGWLKSINDVNNLGTKLFSFAIEYDGNNPLYNGNISKIQWRTANVDNTLKSYTFAYDDLNRLTNATDNTGHYNLSVVAYDKNGNITNLHRKGHLASNPNPNVSSQWGTMDILSYTYQNNSNKLLRVYDASLRGRNYGFKDGANRFGTDFVYDTNGNMISDANKGITSINYNYLNVPTEVKFNNSNTKKINYIYDAIGIKLRKVVNDNGSVTTTDYVNGYVYENNTLQYFQTSEGYVNNNNGIFSYVYQYKDHLGNIRLSYSDSDNNGTISQSEIIEENNYYPFGLLQKGYNKNVSSNGNSVAQKKKFGGFEYQEELNLNWYDMSARNYDPALGRWMNLDPSAAKYVSVSPYTYALNNPVYFTDPDGKDVRPSQVKGTWVAFHPFGIDVPNESNSTTQDQGDKTKNDPEETLISSKVTTSSYLDFTPDKNIFGKELKTGIQTLVDETKVVNVFYSINENGEIKLKTNVFKQSTVSEISSDGENVKTSVITSNSTGETEATQGTPTIEISNITRDNLPFKQAQRVDFFVSELKNNGKAFAPAYRDKWLNGTGAASTFLTGAGAAKSNPYIGGAAVVNSLLYLSIKSFDASKMRLYLDINRYKIFGPHPLFNK